MRDRLIDIDRFALGTEYVIDPSKSRLLLVQSEPVLAELTQFRLKLLGYQIEIVASGVEATAAIGNAPHDLVVVDTALPDGDGIE